MDFGGSEQFSYENPQNFGAWGEVLPERGQKRSGHENHGILQSVTWPCSKPDFSRTFEGSPSRIFGDFRRFHDFASFFYVVLNASRKQIAFRYVHFLGFCMDPNNFRFKIRLEQSVGGRARREAGQFEVYTEYKKEITRQRIICLRSTEKICANNHQADSTAPRGPR